MRTQEKSFPKLPVSKRLKNDIKSRLRSLSLNERKQSFNLYEISILISTSKRLKRSKERRKSKFMKKFRDWGKSEKKNFEEDRVSMTHLNTEQIGSENYLKKNKQNEKQSWRSTSLEKISLKKCSLMTKWSNTNTNQASLRRNIWRLKYLRDKLIPVSSSCKESKNLKNKRKSDFKNLSNSLKRK